MALSMRRRTAEETKTLPVAGFRQSGRNPAECAGFAGNDGPAWFAQFASTCHWLPAIS
jgi:hypothetical protein